MWPVAWRHPLEIADFHGVLSFRVTTTSIKFWLDEISVDVQLEFSLQRGPKTHDVLPSAANREGGFAACFVLFLAAIGISATELTIVARNSSKLCGGCARRK